MDSNHSVNVPGLWNELPQTWWLQTAEINSLSIQRARGRESRGQQDCALSGGSREERFLALSSSGCCQSFLTL